MEHRHPKAFSAFTRISFLMLNALVSPTFACPAESNETSSIRVLETLFPNHRYDLVILKNLTSRNLESIPMAQAQLPASSVRSILHILIGGNISKLNKSLQEQVEFSKMSRFSSGYIHAYFISPELDFSKISILLVKQIMVKFRNWKTWPNWPNDFVFFTNHKNSVKSRIRFYMQQLPKTFTRGVILDVDLSSGQVALVCLSCPESMVLSTWTQDGDAQSKHLSQLSYHQHLTSQLHNQEVTCYSPEDTNSLLKSCNILAHQVLTTVDKSSSGACFHLILREKLNYTCTKMTVEAGTQNLQTTFRITTNFPFFKENKDEFGVGRQAEWVSYWVEFYKFNFLPFQKPSSGGQVLSKPYDWGCWVSIFSAAASLAMVTVLFRNIHGATSRSPSSPPRVPVTMSIVATMLHQIVSKRFTKRVIFGSQVLPCLWILWIFVMIVVEHGYTGLIFSLMAKGRTLYWPGSLSELVWDPSYCIFSGHIAREWNETGHLVNTWSRVRFFFINPTLEGKFGSDQFLVHLIKLNDSLRFVQKNGTLKFGVEREIVEGNFGAGGDFKVGQDDCQKFAFVEEDPREDGMFISQLQDKAISGRMVGIPGHLSVVSPAIERNYFHERFLTVMAYLEASGFLVAVNAHVKKWYICSRIYAYLRDSRLESKEWRKHLVNCVHQVDQFLATDRIEMIRDSEDGKPISLRRIKAGFKMLAFGLTIAVLAMILEIIGRTLQVVSNKVLATTFR